MPYVRFGDRLRPATWGEAFRAATQRLADRPGEKMAAIVGDIVDAEAMTALKDLMDACGCPNVDCRQDGAKIGGGASAGWRFNTTIAGIEDADALLLVGTNPRWEASLLNARIRKRWLQGGFRVGLIGEAVDLTYDYQHIGTSPDDLAVVADGGHPFAQVLKSAERPMVIVGMGALTRPDGEAVLDRVRGLAESCGMVRDDWNGFNVLHGAAGRVAGLELGLVPGASGRDVEGILAGVEAGEIEVVWLLGADEIDTSRLEKATVIYQGHHGDAGAHVADVVLPGAAYTEKDGTWVNTEGRVQLGRRAAFPPGEAREDWAIIRALSEALGKTLPYDDLAQLRARMVELAPGLAELDVARPGEWGVFGQAGEMSGRPFANPVADFYLTNPICRASTVMAECSAMFVAGEEATGTDG